ncbi:MAG: carbon-nitrogen hydrolase family protein [Armatimonadetes bacterium]|nr:carbon-nitrogen hydrolase family protein [Armatimonadota bacterium]HOQ30592.1 carbon-nitrogen hydrolase family protein [Armatimonadota bacterium]
MRREVTLASISHRPPYGCHTPDAREAFLKETDRWLRRAKNMGAEIVAFPEIYPQIAAPDHYAAAEPHDGGTLPAIQALCRELDLYVIWPRYESRPTGLYNTAILIGRDGEVIGRYDKMFPTLGEMEKGVRPGTSCPRFETDFGRVSMAICFDLNFIEIRDELRADPPDVLFFCSLYRGGVQLQEWAIDLGCHVMSAIGTELGRLVDPGGQVLKLSTYETLLAARVNTNKRQLHMDFNWHKMDDMLARYGSKLTFEYYTPEARFVIGYQGTDRDVDEILAEFDLLPIQEYWARVRRTRAEKLAQAS